MSDHIIDIGLPPRTDIDTDTRQPGRSPNEHPQQRVQQAKQRIAEFGLPVRQGKSDRAGKWYDKPTQYPVALCDANGVLIIQTNTDLEKLVTDGLGYFSQREDGREDTVTFREGISQITGYLTFAWLAGKIWEQGHWRDRARTLSQKMLELQELLREMAAEELEPGYTIHIHCPVKS